MYATRGARGLSDRTLDRSIRVLALVLVIGVPLVGLLYWFDRHVDPGASFEARAVAAAEAALRDAPNDLDARNRLAAAYVAAGRVDDGIAQFSEVLRVAPSNRDALLGRGLALLGRDDLEGARIDFQAFVDGNRDEDMAGSDPQLKQAYDELGTIALRQDRASDAVAAFGAALKIDRSDADALYGLGRALIATGEAAKGVEALRRSVAYVPTGWCEPYAALADGYAALGDADGVAYADGMVAFCRGDVNAATTRLRALVGGRLGADALVGLASVAAQQGDRETAASLYRQVLAREPGNLSAAIGLQALGTSDAHASVPAVQPARSP